MNRKAFSAVIAFFLLMPLLTVAEGTQEKGGEKEEESFNIAVFVPGVVAGSPLYEDLVSGTEKAADEYTTVSVKVIEGGFNQGEWAEKLTSLAAGDYDVIVTSNPAMPSVAEEVMENFPDQKFINLDAYLEGNPRMYTLMYNQVEQGYLVGYLGGLITKSDMKGANAQLKVGMIVAQEYPVMNKMIKPGYEKGIKAVDPDIQIDYRVIGNWYDANKAADLAHSMFDGGVDVILTIAGGANQGSIKAAEERGRYILYFDTEDYELSPGTIAGCAVLHQERAAYETVKKAIKGNLPYGTADIVDMEGGYVDFADDDPLYRETVSAAVREKMGKIIEELRNGELSFPAPRF